MHNWIYFYRLLHNVAWWKLITLNSSEVNNTKWTLSSGPIYNQQHAYLCFVFQVTVSLYELLSQKIWSRREDRLQFLYSIWNGQIKLRTSTQCETHLPALDVINSWSERGKSDWCMKTRNLRKYYNLFINITHLASLGSRLVCSENVLHAGIPSSRAEFFTSTSLCKGFDNS